VRSRTLGALAATAVLVVSVLSGGSAVAGATVRPAAIPPASLQTDGAYETVIEPFSWNVSYTRLAGADRYATAVAASQRFAPRVPAVFVAVGTDFPDALSAAAAAAELGGPLLLTAPAHLPAVVAAELRRLAPARIYIAGGTGTVSAQVEKTLSSIAPTTRFSGANRYETSLAIAKAVFPDPGYSQEVFLTTGRNFPDALSASAAAGSNSTPVLLIDGSATRLSAGTVNALRDLGGHYLRIVGGTGAVSLGIERQLRAERFHVTRFAGANRYATAVAVNDFFLASTPDTVFFATGANFPDALASGALAGQIRGPVYLTGRMCMPAAVRQSVLARGHVKRVVMGGEAVVDGVVVNDLSCRTPSTPTPAPRPPRP